MALAGFLSELSLLLPVVTHILHTYRAQSITNVQLDPSPPYKHLGFKEGPRSALLQVTQSNNND